MYVTRFIEATIAQRFTTHPVVIIEGARSVGKTRLLARLLELGTIERSVSLTDAMTRSAAGPGGRGRVRTQRYSRRARARTRTRRRRGCRQRAGAHRRGRQPRRHRHRASAEEAVVIHPLNLAEVLVGAVRAGRGHELVDDLHAIGVRAADSADGERLSLATLRVETRLKLPDCCALDTALTSESTLATFAELLAAVARARHVRVGPASV